MAVAVAGQVGGALGLGLGSALKNSAIFALTNFRNRFLRQLEKGK